MTLTIILVFAVAIIYVVIMIWDAKQQVKITPRTEMFVCDRHGAVPTKYAVKLDMAGVTEDPIDFCPFCFEEKMKAARGTNAKKNH